jgi:hypothetical protein
MMFRIISKKEYQLLQEQNMERFKELWEMADAEVKKLQEENKKLKERNDFLEDKRISLSHALMEANKEDFEQRKIIEEYKKLYADELQKRLDLAARVREHEKEYQKEENK